MRKLLLLVGLSLIAFVNPLLAQIPASEKEALIALYNSTNGVNWDEMVRWDLTKDPTKWQGVAIRDNHVVALVLSRSNLVGTLPEGILSKLPMLETLDLAGNTGLTGAVPQDITSLTKLKQLILPRTGFTGEFPSMNGFTELEVVDISSNNYKRDPKAFTATMPDFGNMPNLFYFDAAYSGMKGTISEGIGKCTELYFFDITCNWVEGSLPESLKNCTKVADFSVQDNELSGEIPDLSAFSGIRQSANTYGRFFLNNNQFSGNFPQWLGRLVEARRVSLANNQLTGVIPDDLSTMRQLETLFVDHNKLSGELPKHLPETLGRLVLSHNRFVGSIPKSWESAKELNNVDLSHNELSGKVGLDPSKLEQLETVRVGYNRFTFADFEGWQAFAKDDLTQFYFGIQKLYNEPQNVYAKSGERATLDASLTPPMPSEIALSFKWFFGDKMTELPDSPNSAKLEINSIAKEHEGFYICIATTDFFGSDPTGELGSQNTLEALRSEEEVPEILIPTMAIKAFKLLVDKETDSPNLSRHAEETPYLYAGQLPDEVQLAHADKVKSLSIFDLSGNKILTLSGNQLRSGVLPLSSSLRGSFLVVILTAEGEVVSSIYSR